MDHPARPSVIVLSVSAEELCAIIHRSVNAVLDERQPSQPEHRLQVPIGYLSREEAAELLHVSVSTLRKYEKTGELLPCRIGRRVLFRKEDVDAALQRNQAQRRHG